MTVLVEEFACRLPLSSTDQRRLVVVVAHPDDETYGTGSVLLPAHSGPAR